MSNASSSLPKQMVCPPSDDPLRIAIVYSRLPFPMMRGDQLTVAHLISFLAARGHSIDLYTLDMQGDLSPEQRTWLAQNCNRVRIYRQGIWRQLRGLIWGLLNGVPIQVGLFRNMRLARDLHENAAAGQYDMLYCYYMRSAPAMPMDLGLPRRGDDRPSSPSGRARIPTFLAMQLSQSLNSRRIRDNEKNPFKKLFYRIETRLCEHYEARIWQGFTRSVLIGPADVAAVEEVCAAQGQPVIDNWVYGAHGTDIDRYSPAREEEIVPNRIVFSGSMLYQPNVQAVLWFVETCWPRIRQHFPTAQFIVQGRDPMAAIRALHGTDGIVVTGTVADIGHYVRSAAICINPVQAAGGMQNKLIEYMASTKAVVATSIANEGIMAPPDTLRLADGPEAFAAAVIDLLEQPGEALALGLRARDYVVENWTWESHFMKLEAAFRDSLVSDAPAAAPRVAAVGEQIA